ncbi:hypothetical protein [Paenibacillus sp. GCM10023252]|uniref:hypothetical protein n=1 Tax=Paenibacillus sp. GCM10023252 TaxID=3252649 RepID=UPI0036D2BF5A
MDESILFVEQLNKEIGPKHLLAGVRLKTIARRFDQDDVLFQLIDEPHKYVEVHLTWTNNKNNEWPRAKIFNSFEEWIQMKMIPDHKLNEV